MRYAFEAIMTNEFRTVNGPCASLIPRGPGYENVSLANQVCSTVGSLPGQPLVSGQNYLRLSFGYFYKNTWHVSSKWLYSVRVFIRALMAM